MVRLITIMQYKKMFKGYEEKKLKEFEYETFPLHTIVYGGTSTGKTYFVKHYLELYKEEKRPIIVVWEDKSEWVGYTMAAIKNIEDFNYTKFVLDDMAGK